MILSEKTKFIIFSLRNEVKFEYPLKFHEFQCFYSGVVNCGCLELEEVNKIKYLGLVIDNRLTWKEHILKLKRRCALP